MKFDSILSVKCSCYSSMFQRVCEFLKESYLSLCLLSIFMLLFLIANIFTWLLFFEEGTASEDSDSLTRRTTEFSHSRSKYAESKANSNLSSEVTEEELDEDEIQSPPGNIRGGKSSKVYI